MSPRRRWGVWLTLLAVAGALVLSERDRAPDNVVVEDVPKKPRVPEPSQPAPAARASTPPAAAPVALALRPSIEIAGPIVEKPPAPNEPNQPREPIAQKSTRNEPNEPASRARAETPASGPMILALRERQTASSVANSFAPHDWTPPPPPRAKPPPPPPPTAPPIPYKVIGKKFEDGAWQVFLARQDQVFVVKPQDTLENTYRVEETKPPVMTLTYLPLQQRQTLPIGGVE